MIASGLISGEDLKLLTFLYHSEFILEKIKF